MNEKERLELEHCLNEIDELVMEARKIICKKNEKK